MARMKPFAMLAAGAAAAALLAPTAAWAQGAKPLRRCAPDAVIAGTVCMDTYEASVWRVPDPTGANKLVVKRIQQGKVTEGDLTAGATQLGTVVDNYQPCQNTAQNCAGDIYAASLLGVTPSAFITWFQAQEACANSGKRLPTSAEWQVAANGTPDPGADNGTTDCNTTSGFAGPVPTGSRSGCVSSRGAFDMVGNHSEWVADWVPSSTDCPGWGVFSNDNMCLSGASTTELGPGALVRGGAHFGVADAGPLYVLGSALPTEAFPAIGFRCAR